MGDWLLNLPIPWMALVIFGAVYLVAAAIYLTVTRIPDLNGDEADEQAKDDGLAVRDRARAFKALAIPAGPHPVCGD